MAGARAGIGLRFAQLAELEAALGAGDEPPAWLEVHAENLFGLPDSAQERLLALRRDHAWSLHGVSLSLGSADGTDAAHLKRLRTELDRYQPELVSEHLSWNRLAGVHVPDLLPLPFTREALAVVAANVSRSQDVLQRTLAIENLSAYLRWDGDEMSEADFLVELVARTGCRLLVDLNNLRVNQLNLGEDPVRFLERIPAHAVAEFHLAGPSAAAGGWIDTHATPVPDEVWDLYTQALERFGAHPTIVEWDTDLPALPVLIEHAARADRVMADAARLCPDACRAEAAPQVAQVQTVVPAPPAGQLTRLQAVWLDCLRAPDRSESKDTAWYGWQGGTRLPQYGFAIYVNNVRATVMRALEQSFPATYALAGGALFGRAVLRCLRDTPPHSGDLADYGADLPVAIREVGGEAVEQSGAAAAALSEVARYEWLADQLPRRRAEPAWTLAQAAALPAADWPALRLRLVAQTALFISSYPVREWLAHALTGTTRPIGSPTHPASECLLLVARSDGLQVLELDPDEAEWLLELQAHGALADATAHVVSRSPGFDLQNLLLRLLSLHALAQPCLATSEEPLGGPASAMPYGPSLAGSVLALARVPVQ
jgi:uncharacterized protein